MQDYFKKSFLLPHYKYAVREHKKIYEALQHHDSVEAKKCMAAHIERSLEWRMGG